MRLALIFVVALLLSVVGRAESPEAVEGAQTVSLQEAFELFRQGALFIDVRDHASWQIGHVAGSVHLDFTSDEFVALYSSESLDRDLPIVFYCDSELHNASAMASYFAAQWGYTNVHYFREGYFAWLAMDAPMTMGEDEYAQYVSAPNTPVQSETMLLK